MNWAEFIFYTKRTQKPEVSRSAYVRLRDESKQQREVDLLEVSV